MEELLFFALLGTQVILILILIVIALRCSIALVKIGNSIQFVRNFLNDSEGRVVDVANDLRDIHKLLMDIEHRTRKPPPEIEG